LFNSIEISDESERRGSQEKEEEGGYCLANNNFKISENKEKEKES
jgi:hypothetical protein